MFKKPCPCNCGKMMGSADRRWMRHSLVIQANLEALAVVRENVTEREQGILDTFMRDGRSLVRDIEGWTHSRVNVMLDARRVLKFNEIAATYLVVR